MASKELISADTGNLTEKANKRVRLSYIAHYSFVFGEIASVTSTITNAVAERHELFLISLICSITAPVVFGIFSKINNGKLESLEEEINLRKGQLRFWDRGGKPRVMFTENS